MSADAWQRALSRDASAGDGAGSQTDGVHMPRVHEIQLVGFFQGAPRETVVPIVGAPGARVTGGCRQ